MGDGAALFHRVLIINDLPEKVKHTFEQILSPKKIGKGFSFSIQA
jgi:hypothetical protein